MDFKYQKPRSKISAFIVACNEEDNIERAIRSVLWCDEIIVIDSGSSDNTQVIARKLGANVIYNEWRGYKEQKQFGLNLCKHEWVLNIDADEEVSNALKEEILELLTRDRQGEIKVNGCFINRVVFYMGEWMDKGLWFPEYRLRLFRRKHAKWGGTNPHEKAIVSGKTTYLQGYLYHYPYRNFEDHCMRIISHSRVSARSIKPRFYPSFLMATAPLIRFVKMFILKGGWKMGIRGFIGAVQEAYGCFTKYVFCWELHNTKGAKSTFEQGHSLSRKPKSQSKKAS